MNAVEMDARNAYGTSFIGETRPVSNSGLVLTATRTTIRRTVYWDTLAKHDGNTVVRQLTAFELLEQRLQRERALREKQAAAAGAATNETNESVATNGREGS